MTNELVRTDHALSSSNCSGTSIQHYLQTDKETTLQKHSFVSKQAENM
jgi:hypothetical protein